jgi:hypothetical protein
MKYNLEEVKNLTIFIMNSIAENRSHFIINGQIDLDLVASHIWDHYTWPYNEEMINEAIDLFYDAVEANHAQ